MAKAPTLGAKSSANVFKKGETVTHLKQQRAAVVVRYVKSRDVVTIIWDDTGDWYDATPANLVRMP